MDKNTFLNLLKIINGCLDIAFLCGMLKLTSNINEKKAALLEQIFDKYEQIEGERLL